MFFDRLDKVQQQAVLDLLSVLACADRDFSPEEEAHLARLASNFQLEIRGKDRVDVDQALASLQSYESKIIALQEMIKLAYKDGHYGEEEQTMVIDFANRMGIHNADLLVKIEDWVRQGFAWMDEGEDIIKGLYRQELP